MGFFTLKHGHEDKVARLKYSHKVFNIAQATQYELRERSSYVGVTKG